MVATQVAKRLTHIARNASDRVLRPQSMIVAGQLAYDVIHTDDLASVRHYAPLTDSAIEVDGVSVPVEKKQYAVPLVIVAPLAVNMLVYDLLPQRSFVKFLLAKGFDVYLVDWGQPTRQHADYTLDKYALNMLPSCIKAVKAHSGKQEVSLHGWSMGGGLSLIYTALFGEGEVRNLITLGTPIDGHANGFVGKQYKRLAGLMNTLRLNFRKLPAKWAYTPGWANVVGFKLLDPVGSAKGYWNLVRQLENRQYVEQHANQAAFIDSLEAYPGGVMRDWMASVWLENETSKGRFTVGSQVAHLNKINANLLAIAGKSDSLSNVPCCKGLMKLVSSQDKEFFVGPGGHIGIVSGKESPVTLWAKTAEWLAARSV